MQIELHDSNDNSNQSTTNDKLLGLVSISIFETKIDRSGEGIPTSLWYNLRQQGNSVPQFVAKIRVELSYLLTTRTGPIIPTTDTAESPVDETNKNGWFRGTCIIPDCECKFYQSEDSQGGACQSCGHWPAQHTNMGGSEPFEPPPEEFSGAGETESIAKLKISDLISKFSINSKPSESWEVNALELDFAKKLGEGPLASTFCGVYQGKEVAIKVYKDKVSRKTLEEYKQQFEVASKISSPHVSQFLGACLKPSLTVVQEFFPRGSLYDVLNDPKEKLDWDFLFHTAIEILKGLSFLHTHRPLVLHRNLRSSNVLIEGNGDTKLSDFGKARFVSADGSHLPTLGKLCGNYAHCAPEIYFGKNFSEQSDLYSFGIVLWEIVNRLLKGKYEQPFSDSDEISFHFQVIVQSAKKNRRPAIPSTCPTSIVELMQRCWHKEPSQRTSVYQVSEDLKILQEEYKKNMKAWNSALV
mmetsp:Transcript_112393/g.168225  ORF Transcript_112393/g.168225 Transcript_112393/m.168225 type:complete len:469 (+) Transcript_112393:64-1470(+)